MTKKLMFSCNLILMISACTNVGKVSKSLTTTNDPSLISGSTSSSTFYTHYLKNVTINSTSTVGVQAPTLQLTLTADTSRTGYQALTTFCGTGGTNPCSCNLVWTERNTVGGTQTSFQRTKTVAVTAVQSGLVKCNLLESVWNEIVDTTTIQISIIAGTGNSTGINSQPVSYKKGTALNTNGDFLDSTMTPFRNIMRYSCFSKWKNAHQMLNQAITAEGLDSGGNTITSSTLINQFCTGFSASGTCVANPRSGWSAQSYYRNLYVRSDLTGLINSTNAYYDCPKVKEPLLYSAGTVPTNTVPQYWPLDSSFALAVQKSTDWSVPVESASTLVTSGSSAPNYCDPANPQRHIIENGIKINCLGWAKVPNPGGTCGTITDNNGRTRPLTRLRRYRVLYPSMFQGDGKPRTGPPPADEVYVADRLVVDSNGALTGNMIYGPKPCNTAWFDHEGIVNRDLTDNLFRSTLSPNEPSFVDVGGTVSGTEFPRPAYVSTHKYFNHFDRNHGGGNMDYYASVNPDGVAFPNFDFHPRAIASVGSPKMDEFTQFSCGATFVNPQTSLGSVKSVRLVTSNLYRQDYIDLGSGRNFYLNEVHVKPVDPWLPNYVEDTSFQACVPISDPYTEPPLHFYKSGTGASATYGWCTKNYPTQNPYWSDLNAFKVPTGNTLDTTVAEYIAGSALVNFFTSHEVGGGSSAIELGNNATLCTGAAGTSQSADICTMTGTAGRCPVFLQGAQKPANTTTCDRTVVYDSNQAYRGFPLQAEDNDIQDLLEWDIGAKKMYTCQYSVHSDPTKIGAKTPISGCCGVVNGTSILNDLVDTGDGHLEPYKSATATNPNVRFCGNPVQ